MIQSGSVLFRGRGVSSAKKYLFITLLLSSVCFPSDVFAGSSSDEEEGFIGISTPTALQEALLGGGYAIELIREGNGTSEFGYAIEAEEAYKFRADDSIAVTHQSWLTSDFDLTFSGVTSFQNAYYDQKMVPEGSSSRVEYITDFKGGAIHNKGSLLFLGKEANFLDNTIDTIFIDPNVEIDKIKGQGGAIYNEKDFVVADTVTATFRGNEIMAGACDKKGAVESSALGGGLYNSGNALFKGVSNFIDNKVETLIVAPGSISEGGGVYNVSNVEFHKDALFQGNMAISGRLAGGGGLYNSGLDNINNSEGEAERIPTVTFKGKTTFKQNVAQTEYLYSYGGGLYNSKGHINFEDSAVFSQNKVILTGDIEGDVASGAGLYSLGKNAKTTFAKDVVFDGNEALVYSPRATGSGAGLLNSDGEVVFNGKASFQNNKITAANGFSYGKGAAIHTTGMKTENGVEGKVIFNDSAEFKANSISAATHAVGGAIANYSTIEFNGSQSTILFQGNTVQNLVSEEEYIAENPNPINVEFIQARGGAVYNSEGNTTFGAGTSVVFKENKALSVQEEGLGGALFNDFYSQTTDTGTIKFLGSVSFENNEASTAGGAVYNKGNMILGGTTRLSGNQAPKGGAVYNDSSAVLTLSGSDVAFKDNHADLGAHIYNLGTVKVHNVHDIMDVDYEPYTTVAYPKNPHTLFDKTGDIYNQGAIEIDHSDLQLFGGINTKQKNKEGSVSIEKSRVDLGKNTIYADTVDIKKNSKVITHIENGSNGKIEANTVSISSENTSLGVVVGVGEIKKGETKEYQIIKASKSNGDFQNLSENMLYEVKEKKGADGVYQIRKLTDGEAQLKADEMAKNPYCKDGKCDEYSKEASNAWIDNEKITGNEQATAVQEKLNELAQLNGTNTDDYQDAINALTPDSSALITAHSSEVTRQISNALGQRFYDAMEKSHFVYNGKVHYKAPKETSRVWVNSLYSMGENDGKKPFEMDTIGFIAGVETPIDRNLKVGAAYSYSFSDGKGMNRDTEIQTHAGIIYGQYQPNRFYANGFLMYGRSTVKEERNVLSQKVESEYDINIAAAEMIAGYKLGPVVVGKWVSGVLSPEAGLRYVYTKQKEYTDTLGQTVEAADAHALTGILGARYTVGYSLSPSIQWYPELRAAVTYDFISPSMDNQVVLLNGAGYSLESEEMDKFGIEIGLKVGFEIDKRTEIGLEYEGLFKGDYTNHTGTANVKYNF